MLRKVVFASMLATVLSAGALSFKTLSTGPRRVNFCSSVTCTAANPGVCGRCFCNLPQGFCTIDPIGAKHK